MRLELEQGLVCLTYQTVYRIVARHGSTFARRCGVDLGIATTWVGISIKSRLVVNGYNAES